MKALITAGMISMFCATVCTAQKADFSGGTKFPAEIREPNARHASVRYTIEVRIARVSTDLPVKDSTSLQNLGVGEQIPPSMKKWSSKLRDVYEHRLLESLPEKMWFQEQKCKIRFFVHLDGQISDAEIVKEKNLQVRNRLEGYVPADRMFEQICTGVARSLNYNPALRLPDNCTSKLVQVDIEVLRTLQRS